MSGLLSAFILLSFFFFSIPSEPLKVLLHQSNKHVLHQSVCATFLGELFFSNNFFLSTIFFCTLILFSLLFVCCYFFLILCFIFTYVCSCDFPDLIYFFHLSYKLRSGGVCSCSSYSTVCLDNIYAGGVLANADHVILGLFSLHMYLSLMVSSPNRQ